MKRPSESNSKQAPSTLDDLEGTLLVSTSKHRDAMLPRFLLVAEGATLPLQAAAFKFHWQACTGRNPACCSALAGAMVGMLL
jgi:hypothetical protein